MKKITRISVMLALCAALFPSCKEKTVIDVHEFAVKVADKGIQVCNLGDYRGVGLAEGLAELAVTTGRQDDMDRVMELMRKYGRGEVEMSPSRNFYFFDGGGLGACILAHAGVEEVKAALLPALQKQWDEQPRTTDGFIQAIRNHGNNRIFIDVIGSTGSSYMYAGQAFGNQEWLDYGAWNALGLLKLFYDSETGLFHQGRGTFQDKEYCAAHENDIDTAHWSRGNGWACKGIRCMVSGLPHDHPLYNEIAALAKKYYEGVFKYMDENGMFHQEMTDFSSYPEVSGTSYILMGLAACIREGILDEATYRPYFEKGLKGVFAYVDPDGSIGHVCTGCLTPGTGTKEDYMAKPYYYNEDHACGPFVQVLASALSLGYDKITLDKPLGWANEGDREERPAKK